MDTPVEIFLSLIAFTFAMGVIGLWKKIPIMLFIAGAVITFWAIMTDNIVMDSFSTIALTETYEYFIAHMQQNLGTSPLAMNSVNNIFVGEEVVNSNSTLYLKSFNEVTIAGTKQNSPTGTAIVGVWGTQAAPTASNYLFRLGSFDVSTLANSITVFTFRNVTHTYTLLENQAVGVFYNGASGTNTISIMTTSSSQFDGTNSQTSRYTSSWTDVTTDVRMNIRLTTIVEENTINNEYDSFEFTEYPKILFGIIGAIIMLAGAMIWKYEEN